MVKDLLSGEIFNEKQLEEKDLISAILRNEGGDYIFWLLESLLRSSADIGKSLGVRMVDTCFSICLANLDFQESLLENVTRLLASLCSNSPSLIGYILEKSEDSFIAVERIVLRLFEQLPIEKWDPVEADVIILENMLKDPLNSGKSKLARNLISAVNWEEGKSARHCHKALCFAITNLYLDYMGRRKSSGIVNSASKVIFNSAKKLASIVDEEQEFYDWCWYYIM